MTEPRRERGRIQFEDFELDVAAGELRKGAARVRLQEQPFRVLALLLERPGELVTREELHERLWPDDTFVDFDHGLNKAINKLRDALGDSSQEPRFVETLPRRGYRFIADVATKRREGSRLPWMAAALLLAAATASVFWMRITVPEERARDTEKTMLAVLPFENLGSDPDHEYFSDGLTEEMIAQLGSLSPDRLGVIARTSAMHYKGTTKRLDQIASELGVAYVLEGSVRRSDERVRITAQLIQVSDQTHLWAESYDRRLPDVFAIQDDVAERIAGALALELLPPQSSRAHTTNARAHEAYLRGRYFWNKRTDDGFRQGLSYFTEAVEEDPGYAPAHVGVADSYIMLANYGTMPPKDALPHAIASASRALDIDPNFAQALVTKTWAEWIHDLDWTAAEEGFREATRLEPGHPFSHQLYANYLGAQGRHREALSEMMRARELDPLSLVVNSVLAWHFLLSREPDRAIEQCRKTLEIDPTFSRVHSYLGWAYMQKSMYDEAVVELSRGKALFGDSPALAAELAHAFAVAGRFDDARHELNALLALTEDTYIEADLIAKVYAGIGELDEAFSWLERAVDDRAVHRVMFRVDPLLDPMRGDIRFDPILERLSFDEAEGGSD